MKRIGIVLIIQIVLFTSAFSQPAFSVVKCKLKGKVIDNNEGTPLEYATISVFTKDSTLAAGGICGKDGLFTVELDPGVYYAIVQFISFDKKICNNISISKKDQTVNIGTIALQPRSTALSDVTVTAEKSQMVIGLDRKVFNVGKDLSSTGKSAAEILDNIPSVTVDVDGNVSLRGSQNLQIFIDGKPSGLYNAGNSDALRNLPGSLIEKVEIITNPSAKYEAEGMAGIINIILKKDQRKGVNGSFEFSAGYPQHYSVGANVNFRKQKLNYFINYGINYDERPGEGSSFQKFFDTSFAITRITRIETDRLRSGWSQNLRGGADYFINSKNTLTAAALLGFEDEHNTTDILYRDYDTLDVLQQVTKRRDNEKSQEREIELSLNYEKKFDQKDRKLTAFVQYIENGQTEKSNIDEDTILLSGLTYDGINLFQKTANKESERNLLIQADYVHPFGSDGKFETGYRSEFRMINNPYSVEEQDGVDHWVPKQEFTNNFDYTENVHALYIQAGNKFNKFSLQLGLRSELSDVSTYLKDSGEGNDTIYIDFFPTVHTTFQLNDDNSIQLSYSRRINRPQFRSLNPFHTYSDSRNIRTGNPNLRPEYTDAIEAGYLLNKEKLNIYAGLYFRNTKGVIERINKVDSLGITYQIPLNLSKRQSYGAETNLTLDLVKWWTLTSSFNFYRSITNGEYAGRKLESDNYSWDTRLNSKMQFKKGLDFQTIFFYRGPQQTTQGEQKAFYMLNMGLSKDLFKGNATLTLNVRDVLNSRRFRNVIDQPDFYSENEFRWSTRSYSLSFTYRLNQKKKLSKKGENGDNYGGDNADF
jgi:outer membrane receptor protein involved in Fe transport